MHSQPFDENGKLITFRTFFPGIIEAMPLPELIAEYDREDRNHLLALFALEGWFENPDSLDSDRPPLSYNTADLICEAYITEGLLANGAPFKYDENIVIEIIQELFKYHYDVALLSALDS